MDDVFQQVAVGDSHSWLWNRWLQVQHPPQFLFHLFALANGAGQGLWVHHVVHQESDREATFNQLACQVIDMIGQIIGMCSQVHSCCDWFH